jgi:hypothetical protein
VSPERFSAGALHSSKGFQFQLLITGMRRRATEQAARSPPAMCEYDLMSVWFMPSEIYLEQQDGLKAL